MSTRKLNTLLLCAFFVALLASVHVAPVGATSLLPAPEWAKEDSKVSVHVPVPGGIAGKSCIECHIQDDSKSTALTKKYSHAKAWETYMETPHGRMWRLGDPRAPRCSSCHQTDAWSNILPVAHQDSPMHPNNIGKVCSQCHGTEILNARISEGSMHLALSRRHIKSEGGAADVKYGFLPGLTSRESYYFIGDVDILALTDKGFTWLAYTVLTIMFIYVLIDFLRKLINCFCHKPNVLKRTTLQPRFGVMFRIQHFVLLASVIVAIITAFPLKFPDLDFSRKLISFLGGYEMRRTLHVIAGYAMVITGALHIIWYVLIDWRIPFWKREIFPRYKDVTDFFNHNLYNIGLRKEMPEMGRYTWFEKLDYFGAMWGLTVMGITGLMMAFMVESLQIIPLAWLQTLWAAHSEEAMLATLFLAVVHMYHAHFNPERFPGVGTWFHGKISEEEQEKYHSLEEE